MNRVDFMNELALLLQDVPEEERNEAMQYYNDYFEDAGAENEEQVLKELGSPERVAASIRDEIEGYRTEEGEYTDTGYHEPRFENQDMPEKRTTDYTKEEYVYGEIHEEKTEEKKKPWTNKWLKIALIIAIVLCAAPVILPIVSGVIALGLGIITAIVSILVALVIIAVAAVIVGIVMLVMGVIKIFAEAALGLFLIGGGLLSMSLGAAAVVGSVKLCIVSFTAAIRGIVGVFRRLTRRKAVA